jgi:hypothetical protein
MAMKWLYTNGTWAYFCNIATTPTFLFVPFVSLMFGARRRSRHCTQCAMGRGC